MANHSVVISISRGDSDQPTYKESTHILTYSDVELNDAQSKALKDSIVRAICTMRINDKEVFGIYKEETPIKDMEKPQ